MTSSDITSALKHHANSDIVLTLHAVVKVPRREGTSFLHLRLLINILA